MSRLSERRLPTALVLASASAMVSIGAVALYLALGEPAGAESATDDLDVKVRTDSPALAAESFLDAWRKRAHDEALALSTGQARRRVLERRARDAKLTDEERRLKEQVWDRMASSRLHLQVRQSEQLGDGRVGLRGTAVGEFVDRRYERRIAFVLAPHQDGWRVAQMQLGEILTKMPELLELGPPLTGPR